MRNRKRFPPKNQHAFQVFLKALKSNGTLESEQTEGVERMEKLTKAFLHALDTSKSKDAKHLLGLLSKEACNVFLKNGSDGEA